MIASFNELRAKSTYVMHTTSYDYEVETQEELTISEYLQTAKFHPTLAFRSNFIGLTYINHRQITNGWYK